MARKQVGYPWTVGFIVATTLAVVLFSHQRLGGQSLSLTEDQRHQIRQSAEHIAAWSVEEQRQWLAAWVPERFSGEVREAFAPSEWSVAERPVMLAMHRVSDGQPLDADRIAALIEHVERTVGQAVNRSAMRYRIELYNRFRLDRDAYDDRMRQWDDIQGVWAESLQEAHQQQELLAWLASARGDLERAPKSGPFGVRMGESLAASSPVPSPDTLPIPSLPSLQNRPEASVEAHAAPSLGARSSPQPTEIRARATTPLPDPIPPPFDSAMDVPGNSGGSWLQSILSKTGLLNGETPPHSSPSGPRDDTDTAPSPGIGQTDLQGEVAELPAPRGGEDVSPREEDMAASLDGDEALRQSIRALLPGTDPDTGEVGQPDPSLSGAQLLPGGAGSAAAPLEHRETLEHAPSEDPGRHDAGDRVAANPDPATPPRPEPRLRNADFDGQLPSEDTQGGAINREQLAVRIAGFNRALDSVEQALSDTERMSTFAELDASLRELADLSWRHKDLKLYWTLLPPAERGTIPPPDGIEQALGLLRQRIESAISTEAEGSGNSARLQQLLKRLQMLHPDAL